MRIKKHSRKARKRTGAGWSAFDATTDADIARQIARDRDAAPDVSALGPSRVVRPPERIDVRAIRRRLRMSQEKFARRYGFTVASVRNWEQGRRRPEGPARVLLKVIDTDPKAVDRALAGRP